jgi:hypothetical protein
MEASKKEKKRHKLKREIEGEEEDRTEISKVRIKHFCSIRCYVSSAVSLDFPA